MSSLPRVSTTTGDSRQATSYCRYSLGNGSVCIKTISSQATTHLDNMVIYDIDVSYGEVSRELVPITSQEIHGTNRSVAIADLPCTRVRLRQKLSIAPGISAQASQGSWINRVYMRSTGRRPFPTLQQKVFVNLWKNDSVNS